MEPARDARGLSAAQTSKDRLGFPRDRRVRPPQGVQRSVTDTPHQSSSIAAARGRLREPCFPAPS